MQIREYFYHINCRGDVLHDSCIIDDPIFLNHFYKNMQLNSTNRYMDYRYLSICGNEYLFIKPEDTPIVFKYLAHNQLFYTQDLSIEFYPKDLRFNDDGILYHKAYLGLYGRIHPQLIMQFSDSIIPWGPYYQYYSDKTHAYNVILPLHLPDHNIIMHPKLDNSCFGCGIGNSQGLRLTFIFHSLLNSAESWYIPTEREMGALGIMHGGFVSLLLDEVMGKVLSGLGIKAPTAQLQVRFKKPTFLHKPIHIIGELLDISGRKYTLKSKIVDQDGDITAEAEALFIKIKDIH